MVLYALAPKDGAGDMLLALVAGGVAAAGAYGLLKLRGWSVIALAGGAGALLVSLAQLDCASALAPVGNGYAINLWAAGTAALVAIVAALAPLARPVARYLRG